METLLIIGGICLSMVIIALFVYHINGCHGNCDQGRTTCDCVCQSTLDHKLEESQDSHQYPVLTEYHTRYYNLLQFIRGLFKND